MLILIILDIRGTLYLLNCEGAKPWLSCVKIHYYQIIEYDRAKPGGGRHFLPG